jgi:hypothetical protein
MLPKAADVKGRRQLPIPTRNAAKAAAQGPAASGRLPKGVERGHGPPKAAKDPHWHPVLQNDVRVSTRKVATGSMRSALHFHLLVPCAAA